MEPIPGSATAPAGEKTAGHEHQNATLHPPPVGPEAFNTSYPLPASGWWNSGRWASFGGQQPPMTKSRTRAIDAKRTGVIVVAKDDGTIECIGGGVDGHASKPNKKPKNWLAECATGAELLAGFRNGSLFVYPLENRRGKEYVPTTSTAAKWKMRSTHMRTLAVIAGAQIGLKARGVVASHKELAAIATSSGRKVIGLEERQLGTVVRELCAWGLLHSTPVFVPRGAVTSQRGSCYRLTTLATQVYRLKLPAACGDLPEPNLRELPAKKRATGSGRDQQSLPANPETPLRGISPEEHAALHRIEVGSTPGADTATRAHSERAAVAPAACGAPSSSEHPSRAIVARGPAGVADTCELRTASTCPTNRRPHHSLESSTRTDALSDGSVSRESRTPLLCPTAAPSAEAAPELELARRAGDVANDVRDRLIDERYVEGDPRETKRRLSIAKARAVAEEKADMKRRAELAAAQVRRREAEIRRGPRGAVLEDESLEQPAGGVIPPEIQEVLRRHRESMADEQREQRYNLQPPTKPAPPTLGPDAELADKIESIWRTRFGTATVGAQVEIEKWRGGKS